MQKRRALVIHHAPDLDAIGGVWLFTRFELQDFGNAKVFFVNPGDILSPIEISKEELDPQDIFHVDTGRGQFDHHTVEKSSRSICATSLVYEYLSSKHLELSQDRALQSIVGFVTEVDHFGEIDWPEAENIRYSFMIHELIRGQELADQQSDERQLQFGLQCLDNAYNVLVNQHKAEEILSSQGQTFAIKAGKCLAITTKNDDVIKLAQKRGSTLVIRKDPNLGSVRIKVRPDSSMTLEKLYEAILSRDSMGSWYYHPSGKMLINGSRKQTLQKPTPLSLEEIIALVKELYA
ncbi:MAG: hypothetical protein A2632_02760 [Candidatus Pacebacteria bacterium RIFCSPHIGHO2_01_FULL_46_16]|nr:MAG: hypothetical protein A2632_02760 [Candidatus Pacebacteria bacterium RIFCSPHIGHO2_01_FULL_46_16]OGJ21154.1 MAG: hypothetical protein A3J60_01195 [Candidatus Pacebacteria bacterium RIFCSPHIGHO2_02_FULL_46_9]OGJ38923.1 MAG: hypothetical protein A3A82_02075 [Candidatus Pacebacteria bacterium RIFCSPLOWO2_01_FULL_47_12]